MAKSMIIALAFIVTGAVVGLLQSGGNWTMTT